MAGRRQFLAVLIGLSMSLAACSSSDPEIVLPGVAASSSTTEAPPPSVTTTTDPTTTTLSEQALAEAEVEQLVTDFWLSPWDTSTDELRLEYLTGLPARRSQEFAQQVTEAGHIVRNQGEESIEVTGVQVDLEKGEGEANACTGSSGERLDAETLERVVEATDPEYLTTIVFYLVLTPDGWKISELISSLSSTTPELCEISSQ